MWRRVRVMRSGNTTLSMRYSVGGKVQSIGSIGVSNGLARTTCSSNCWRVKYSGCSILVEQEHLRGHRDDAAGPYDPRHLGHRLGGRLVAAEVLDRRQRPRQVEGAAAHAEVQPVHRQEVEGRRIDRAAGELLRVRQDRRVGLPALVRRPQVVPVQVGGQHVSEVIGQPEDHALPAGADPDRPGIGPEHAELLQAPDRLRPLPTLAVDLREEDMEVVGVGGQLVVERPPTRVVVVDGCGQAAQGR